MMEIQVNELLNGDLRVTELAQSQNWYGENTVKWNESVTITVLEKHTVSAVTIEKAFLNNHSTGFGVINTFIVTDDGWYRIYNIILPIKNTGNYYFNSGIFNSTDKEISVEDLIADIDNVSFHSTKDVFVIYNMWQCYLNYCKKLLEGECTKDSKCPESCDNELSRNRNLIWIFLNALQYYVHFGRFEDAQKFLERISGCNGICHNEIFMKTYDCGCGK